MTDVTLNGFGATACSALLPAWARVVGRPRARHRRRPTGAAVVQIGGGSRSAAPSTTAPWSTGAGAGRGGGAGKAPPGRPAVAQLGARWRWRCARRWQPGEALAPGTTSPTRRPSGTASPDPAGRRGRGRRARRRVRVARAAESALCGSAGRPGRSTRRFDRRGRLALNSGASGWPATCSASCPHGRSGQRRPPPIRVGCVEHRATGDAPRTVVLAGAEAAERGRLLDAFDRLLAPLRRGWTTRPSTPPPRRRPGRRRDNSSSPRRPAGAAVPRRADPLRAPRRAGGGPGGARACSSPTRPATPGGPSGVSGELGDVTSLFVGGSTRQAARTDDTTSNGAVGFAVTPTRPRSG